VPENKTICDNEINEYAIYKGAVTLKFDNSGYLIYPIFIYQHFGNDNTFNIKKCCKVGTFHVKKPISCKHDDIESTLCIQLMENFQFDVSVNMCGKWYSAIPFDNEYMNTNELEIHEENCPPTDMEYSMEKEQIDQIIKEMDHKKQLLFEKLEQYADNQDMIETLELLVKSYQNSLNVFESFINACLTENTDTSEDTNKPDNTIDLKAYFKASAKHFYELFLNDRQTNINEQYTFILNRLKKDYLDEYLSYTLPASHDKSEKSNRFFLLRFSLLKEGIDLLESKVKILPEKVSLDEIYSFIDSIDETALQDETIELEKKAYEQARWESHSAYELFKQKVDQYLIEIRDNYDSTINHYIKEIINEFILNRFLPFIEIEMDKIIAYHEQELDPEYAKNTKDLETLRTALLALASLKPIVVKENKDLYDPDLHIKKSEMNKSLLPDRLVLKKVCEGYFCEATNSVIRKAEVVVNYNDNIEMNYDMMVYENVDL